MNNGPNCDNLLPVMGSVWLHDGEAFGCRNCVGRDSVRQFTTRDGIRLAAWVCDNLLPVMGSVWLRDGKACGCRNCVGRDRVRKFTTHDGIRWLREEKRVAAATVSEVMGCDNFTTRDGIRLAACAASEKFNRKNKCEKKKFMK